MGNIIDELLTDEEQEQMEVDTIKEQDQAIMQLNNDKKHYQSLVEHLDIVLNNERLFSGLGAKDFREMVKIRDNLNNIIKNIEQEIEHIWYNG